MITTRHMPLEVELIRWLLLALAALALVMAAATLLAAADPMMEPRLLPGDMGELAKPLLPAETVRPFFPETPPTRPIPPAEMAARLWNILEDHRAGRTADALAGWNDLPLPPATAHWRETAMGAAYLQAGRFERAVVHLDIARQLAPDHPAVAYYCGLLRLEQAAGAGRVPDALNEGRLRMVAFGPGADRHFFENLAINDLTLAAARGQQVQLDERLLAVDPVLEETVVVPRVGDLLAALGADNFAGRAHHVLFGLYEERGELERAELHLNAATNAGLATPFGYQDLAEAYLQMERHADAIRVLRRDVQVHRPEMIAGWNRLVTMTYQTAKGIWVW